MVKPIPSILLAGTYTLTASLSYAPYDDGTHQFYEKQDIILQGTGGKVILDGSNLNSRVLFIRNSDADVTIRDIILTNGYAPEGENGAGLFVNIAGGDLILENCQITNCFSAAFYFSNDGGGAFITAGIGSAVSIRNCVIAGNQAKGHGGGLYLSLTDGVLSFVNNTVVNNLNKAGVIEYGGGIYLRLFFESAVAHFYNNILWGNSYAYGDGDMYIDDAEYDPTKGATVFVQNNDYKQLDWNLGDNIALLGNISLDPLLSADFHLPSSSPCLDAGNAAAPWLSTQDFEGDLRSVDGNCDTNILPDMGADEYYQPPTVSTAAVLDITSTTATGGGNILSEGGHPVTAKGVCWNTSTQPTLADSCLDEGTGNTAFISVLGGLSEGLHYAVRAYATNCEGTSYGEQFSFITTRYPTVVTNQMTKICSSTASGGGDVIGQGDTMVTSRGVCWSTAANPSLTESCTIDGNGSGKFTSSLSGLTIGQKYYVKAYASNSLGTSYGEEVSFTAASCFPWPAVVPGITAGSRE